MSKELPARDLLRVLRVVIVGNAKAGGESHASATGNKTTSHDKKGKTESEGVLKLSWEQKIHEIVGEAEVRFKAFNLKDLVTAIREKRPGEFAKKFMGFQLTASKEFSFIKITEGIDLDHAMWATPVVTKISANWTPEKFMPKLTFTVEVEIHFGLSVAGWEWLAKQVLPRDLADACVRDGLTSTLQALVSEQILVIASSVLIGVAGTAGLVALDMYLTEQAKAEGVEHAIRHGYIRGYVEKIFKSVGRPNPETEFLGSPEEKQRYGALYRAGEADAVRHAGIVLRKLRITSDPDEGVMVFQFRKQLEGVWGRHAESEVTRMITDAAEQRFANPPHPRPQIFQKMRIDVSQSSIGPGRR